MRRHFLVLTLAILAAVAPPGFAAPYPEKPIRLIVPSAPGGAPDVLMRTLAQQLSQQMGVPFVIDNKPGGSYLIGTMELVRAPADGYTLAYGNIVSLATNRALIAKMPYEVDKDLTLISNALRLSNLMIVNNDLPVRNVADLIAYAKKNPGKISFASDGNGTTAHLLKLPPTVPYVLHMHDKGHHVHVVPCFTPAAAQQIRLDAAAAAKRLGGWAPRAVGALAASKRRARGHSTAMAAMQVSAPSGPIAE